jgi:hypothetical protein
MATRTIVTSQPDVACDVCERRLLRGEQHDVFLVAGRRRTVCELCAPRAVHQGWMRESEAASVNLPPTRPRRGRSLFTRLRQRRYEDEGAAREQERAVAAPGAGQAAPDAGETRFAEDSSPARRPFAARRTAAAGYSAPAGEAAVAAVAAHAVGVEPAEVRDIAASSVLDEGRELLESALAIFNSSEHPRRVAGVTRSLGAPEVGVRSAEHARSVVRIVIAWELCWYRYQVDLDELDSAVAVCGQGTELSELSREERAVNAHADSSGLLSLA